MEHARFMVAVCMLTIFAVSASAKVKSTSTWVAPGVHPASGMKILVLARFSEDTAKRIVEDALVAGLAKLKIEAITSYENLTPEDLASDEAIVAKAEALGVAAGIVCSVTGKQTQMQSGPSVHAGVGVPVRAGPFSLFLGTSVPLGGGTTAKQVVGIKGEFFVKTANDPVWIGTYSTDLKSGTDAEARALADTILKQLKTAGFFPKR